MDSEGNELHLRIKRWEHLQNTVPVYNFSVEDYHTYYVGNRVVFVHNMCAFDSECEIVHVYNSIKNAPQYPQGFQGVQNGTTYQKMNNLELLEQLRKIESGQWVKVFKDGYWNGQRVSIHYFMSESGKVFDVKVVFKWSNQ